MLNIKTIKSYFKTSTPKIYRINQEFALEKYMIKLIEEAEEGIRNGEPLTSLEDWREELIQEYNVTL